jgi:hypothetical protein
MFEYLCKGETKMVKEFLESLDEATTIQLLYTFDPYQRNIIAIAAEADQLPMLKMIFEFYEKLLKKKAAPFKDDEEVESVFRDKRVTQALEKLFSISV